MRSSLAAVLAGAAFASAAAAQQAPPKPQGPPPPACREAPYRQFDFWIGEWAVYATGTSYQVGESRVESLYDGCALRENWTALRAGPAGAGGSLNHYDAPTHTWRQTWTDGQASWSEYKGAFENGRLQMVTHDRKRTGEAFMKRMTFTANPDGSVRQQIELSTDDGKTWAMATDLTYRRKPG